MFQDESIKKQEELMGRVKKEVCCVQCSNGCV